MKKIKIFTASVLLLWSMYAQAQKEAYNWFYGSGQGITWNQTQTFDASPTDAPNTTVSLKGIPTRYESTSVRPEMYPMSTREGCFSLSNPNGKLLCYSSGSTIYNAHHLTMENATELEGDFSSAQSGIIIPFPRHRNKYIAISIGTYLTRGFAYNILDFEANNGLGKLELPKNRQFTLPVGSVKRNFIESLMATKHANGVDYWIIAIERTGYAGTSKMVAWLVTENGVSTTPVASLIPNLTMGANETAYGYLKMSSDGKNFALMLHEARNLLWGEFDKRTGIFSNMKNYTAITRQSIMTYGGEFSPDGKYLYVSTGTPTVAVAYVFEFEKLLRGEVNILKTYTVPATNYYAGAFQTYKAAKNAKDLINMVYSLSYTCVNQALVESPQHNNL